MLVENLKAESTWDLTFTIILFLLFFVYTVCVCRNFTKISNTVRIFSATSQFLRENFRIIWTPLFHFLMGFFFLYLWVVSFFNVISMNEMKASETVPQLKTLTWSWGIGFATALIVIMLFWIMGFIQNMSKMIICVATATYYFAHTNMNNVDIKALAR